MNFPKIYQNGTQVVIARENGDEVSSVPTVDAVMVLYSSDVSITVRSGKTELTRVKYTNVRNGFNELVGDKTAVINYLSGFIGKQFSTVTEDASLEFKLDAFGRTRTSDTGQRFDAEFIYDTQPNLFDVTTFGGGSVDHNVDSRDLSLTVGGTTNGYEGTITQHWHNPYTAGNSQVIDITGTLNVAELDGTVEIFVKNGIDSTEETYPQDEWNVNKVSDVDWSKSQILQMDFQSLKVGFQRFLLVRDGIPTVIHKVFNDNRNAGGYWQYPSLPLRWRCYNTATESISEMGYYDNNNGMGIRFRCPVNALAQSRAICGTVKSEGGVGLFDIPGFNNSASLGVTEKNVSTTLVPLISIRPSDLFNVLDNRGLYIPTGFSLQADNPIQYKILLNPTLTGASFTPKNVFSSGMDVDVSATAVSGGEEIDTDYIASGVRNSPDKVNGVLGRTLLSKGYRATGSDILTIAAIRTGTIDSETLASIKWKEIR